MTKLRKFIMKTLLSFTKSQSRSKSLELENETSVPMETTKVVQKKDSRTQAVKGREVGMVNGGASSANGEGVRGREGEGDGDGGREGETEGDSEIEMDTALELVDQMDIEISDGEGEPSPSVPTEGGVEREKKEKEVGAGKGAAKLAPSKEVGREGRKKQPSRRRHSLGMAAVEFPVISMEKQLSDQQTIDLMNLLHVCCGLKVSGHGHVCASLIPPDLTQSYSLLPLSLPPSLPLHRCSLRCILPVRKRPSFSVSSHARAPHFPWPESTSFKSHSPCF